LNHQTAIIVGGGMAGKLIAAAISPYFHRVQILEKDQKPTENNTVRAGVSQGNHIHLLLHAGEHALETLFSGFKQDMVSRGSMLIDSTEDLAWYHHGVWKLQFKGADTTLLQTRSLLESYIEERVNQIANIHYTYGIKVLAYTYQTDRDMIDGVEILENNETKILKTNLVIDASGSSSLTKAWLKKQAISVPEEVVDIGLCYATRQFKLPEVPRDFKIKIVYPEPPRQTLGGTLSMVENGKCIVTLNGYLNSLKPEDVISEDGFIEQAAKLPLPDIHQELVNGTSLSETKIFKVPQIKWRRFDKIMLPEGLLVAGDSICRIDPVFGQGMSIAALEALAIREYLAKRAGTGSLVKLQKKLASIVAPVWSMVLCEDFRYPEVKGKKPFGLRVQQWYVKRIFLLSASNQAIYRDLIKVMNLTGSAALLFKLSTIKAVFKTKI
jgi:2-polyprenyl-6-methoxyphenol hydroxylase-like FAD-dependent oxidoreductase